MLRITLVELIRCISLDLVEHRLQLFVDNRLLCTTHLLLLVEFMEDLSSELNASFSLGTCETLLVLAHLLDLAECRAKLPSRDESLLTIDMSLALLME